MMRRSSPRSPRRRGLGATALRRPRKGPAGRTPAPGDRSAPTAPGAGRAADRPRTRRAEPRTAPTAPGRRAGGSCLLDPSFPRMREPRGGRLSTGPLDPRPLFPARGRLRGGNDTRRSLAFLPMPALLQRVDDLARHVVLVVLGEHGGGGKDPVGAQLAFGD